MVNLMAPLTCLDILTANEEVGPSSYFELERNRLSRGHFPGFLRTRFDWEPLSSLCLAEKMMLSICTLVRSADAARLLRDSSKDVVMKNASDAREDIPN